MMILESGNRIIELLTNPEDWDNIKHNTCLLHTWESSIAYYYIGQHPYWDKAVIVCWMKDGHKLSFKAIKKDKLVRWVNGPAIDIPWNYRPGAEEKYAEAWKYYGDNRDGN